MNPILTAINLGTLIGKAWFVGFLITLLAPMAGYADQSDIVKTELELQLAELLSYNSGNEHIVHSEDGLVSIETTRVSDCSENEFAKHTIFLDIRILDFQNSRILPNEQDNFDGVVIQFAEGYGEIEKVLASKISELRLITPQARTLEELRYREWFFNQQVRNLIYAAETMAVAEIERCDETKIERPLPPIGLVTNVQLGEGARFVELLKQYADIVGVH